MALNDNLWLLHFIDPENFPKLKTDGILRSASLLMSESEKERHEMQKRDTCLPLENGVILRDQSPLTEKIEFNDGTTFPEYVKYINEHVFFWPGKIPEGFGNKYSHHIILRCRLGDLRNENHGDDIFFCRYNSGVTPRTPEKHPRSRAMFKPIASYTNEPLTEIVASCKIRLPPNTEYKDAKGKWCAFFNNTSNKKSPLAPTTFPTLPPIAGARLATIESGGRYRGRDDLMLAVMDEGATAAGVLTRSMVVGAPVEWCRRQLQSQSPRALIVNAGNANVGTGEAGRHHVLQTCEAVAAEVGCRADEVLAASTGVIGEPLPVDNLVGVIPRLAATLAEDAWQRAATAIGTTDTFAKGATASAVISGMPVTINGFAKGSGMIEPDMATLLAFLFTDAAISQSVLHGLLAAANEKSFNAITVDGDTSTSDMCIVFATGKAGNPAPDSIDAPALDDFRRALEEVMTDLAIQVVRDGEGAQKLITVEVCGAENHRAAQAVAKSIANSPLVKTAIAGADANWGRILMAAGKSGQLMNPQQLAITIGGVPVAEQGQRVANYDEAPLERHLQGREILIEVNLGLADGRARVWTCDLTHGYIDINADYRT